MWYSFLTLLACQDPFGADRHDLVGFRIAAITAENDGSIVRPRAAIVVDDTPWSSTPVTLKWYWVEGAGDAAQIVQETPIAEGPSPEILVTGHRLALIATHNGVEARAEINIDDRTEIPTSLHSAAIDLTLQDLTEAQLPLDYRRNLSGAPAHNIDRGGAIRIHFGDQFPAGARGRFMGTGGGTFLEVEHDSTDWFNGDLVIKKEKIKQKTVGKEGIVTVIGLALTESESGFSSLDFFVGDIPDGVWINGRFLPGPPEVTGTIWATLEADDSASAGVRFTDPEAADDDASFDPSVLGCVGVYGSFQPHWLLQQRCDRDALIGQRALLRIDP